MVGIFEDIYCFGCLLLSGWRSDLTRRSNAPLCHTILEDSAAALSHECSTSSDPFLHTIEGALTQYRDNWIAEESAKAERAKLVSCVTLIICFTSLHF